MVTISRNDLQQLLRSCPNLKLVEVLSEPSYQDFHLQGAINVPLSDDFEERILKEIPDKNQTVIVYSLNFECTISEQAVQRLRELGYRIAMTMSREKSIGTPPSSLLRMAPTKWMHSEKTKASLLISLVATNEYANAMKPCRWFFRGGFKQRMQTLFTADRY